METEQRDSQMLAPGAVKCEVHDLYHGGVCFMCENDDPPVTPLRDQDEAPPTKLPYGPLPKGQHHPPNGHEWPKQPGEEHSPQQKTALTLQDMLYGADMDAPSAMDILSVCMELAIFLMKKNAAYGDSALDPVRIMSSADPAEQLRVRMDDKLSRLIRGNVDGEDALKDLVGYWVLLRVAEKRKGRNDV